MRTFVFGLVLGGGLVAGGGFILFGPWGAAAQPVTGNGLQKRATSSEHEQLMAAWRNVDARLAELERLMKESPSRPATAENAPPGDAGNRGPLAEGKADNNTVAEAQAVQAVTTYLDKAIESGVWTSANQRELERMSQTLGPQAEGLHQRLHRALNAGEMKRK